MSRFSFTGRMVQGDCHKAGQQRKDNNGVLKFRKDGTPDCPFYMAVAVPKSPAQRLVIAGTPTFEEIKALMDADARAAWPHFFNTNAQRPPNLFFPASLPQDCLNPKFANKVIDGDGYDENGQPNSAKDGWAGCWVIKVSNGFAPAVYEWMTEWVDPRGARKTDSWIDVSLTGRKIKCGDYVTVSGDCSSNQSTTSPGMYMNVDTVSFEQEGAAIIGSNSVDPNQALGRRGGQATPPAAGGTAHPPASAGAGSYTPPAPTPPASPTAPAYSDYRTGAAAPPPPPAAAGPQMTAAAQAPYDEYIRAGWTDDQLRQNGLMA